MALATPPVGGAPCIAPKSPDFPLQWLQSERRTLPASLPHSQSQRAFHPPRVPWTNRRAAFNVGGEVALFPLSMEPISSELREWAEPRRLPAS